MLYLAEVPDSVYFLEFRLEEITEKTDKIDTIAGRVEGLLIQELLERVDTLEVNVGRIVNYEYGDSSSGFVAHMEECVNELDNSQKTLSEMINDMSEDFRAILDVVRNENTDVLEPKPFCGVRDAKALENFIFDLKQYFKATNTVTEESKVTLAMMHLYEDAKFGNIREYVKQFTGLMLDIRDMSKKDKVFCFVEGLKPWAKTKLYEQRVQDITSAYAAAKRLFDLTSDSQDVRHHQSSSPGRNRNSRPSSPKAIRGDKRSSKDRLSYQSNT
ncbi:uncharacterized protein E5676_scaffold726G00120 [Cucumis melo var. makuwa]|uniref:Reverse transcriptase n=1 Tax=Cucumis melo var. makuwa TaxID=1194695 RepID=A0A5D3B9X7_CUCMM|nr:uncharacterized protein E6C27_scaffold560G00450 [Cucumis melo var. makuwa]TYJ95686.1 uncharacterized protein E5676_scaffold726G00120 [Cucumis melo var. makuwa]